MIADARELHVAVVHLSQHVLEAARATARGLTGATEAELGRLEHVPQALCRDPHVVLGLDLVGVERTGYERAQLIEAYAHDPGRVLGERPGGI
jgi:hypothetical protein